VAFVYILRCRDGSLYSGVAKDLAARVRRHQAGRASRYTRTRLPVALVWWREVAGWGAALREEHRIKTLRREAKEALIAAGTESGPSRDSRGDPLQTRDCPG
jgi:putative endonuclease